MGDEFFTIGIIGHRDLGGEDVRLYVEFCCHKILTELKATYPKIRAISAISPGADSIFAQCAVSLSIPLESVIPFEDFESDFTEEVSRQMYKNLRKSSDLETKVNFSKRNSLAYRRSMERVVFKSNAVIAVWDGKQIGSIGGTWEALLLCEKLNKPLISINIPNRTMSLYFDDRNEPLVASVRHFNNHVRST